MFRHSYKMVIDVSPSLRLLFFHGLMKLLKFKHSITFLWTSIFSVVCYCLMNPETVRIEELCLIFSMFWSVLEDQSRKLFAETYVIVTTGFTL